MFDIKDESKLDYKMYILVNEDIKISKGKLAGQVGHAVMSYIYHNVIVPLGNGENGEDLMCLDEYMKTQKKIILKCPQRILEDLERTSDFIVIRDKGFTQLKPNTLTCVNCGIMTQYEIPEWIRDLKLYS